MNERIKELAEQAGLEWVEMMQTWLANDVEIERFAELVIQNYAEQLIPTAEREAQIRADEREACAKVCWEMSLKVEDIRKAALEVAFERIQARGNT